MAQFNFVASQNAGTGKYSFTKKALNIRIYILASEVEMASPGNQHCANCIGTFSFPIYN